jgi:hypothetical protein
MNHHHIQQPDKKDMKNNGDSFKSVMVDLNVESQMDLHHHGLSDLQLQQKRPSLAFAMSLVVLGLLGYVIICLYRHGTWRERNSMYYHF